MEFFREGHNCWQVAHAGRVTFLVDGEAYFRAVADTCEAAEQAVYIIGWDIDSRILLRRDDADVKEDFGRFLDRLACRKPNLDIYILAWDFAVLYSLERQVLPLVNFGWKTHKRVHFVLDDDHPVSASHHQKIVAVDDRVAFVGGFDLTSCRWDTTDHAPDNPKRCDNETKYGPFHDVQMMVDGQAAEKLAHLARIRWERITGDRLPSVKASQSDPWPDTVSPDLENARVAISRTMPEYEGESEIREIENFYLDAIDRARSYIYIENQYFSSHVVGTALEKILRKKDGPEVLLVVPKKCSGWLEEETMGALRKHLLERLHQADAYGRLKVCYPDLKELTSDVLNVHSKVLVIDDDLLSIGSANLSNRSMGFDTECNLALYADTDKRVGKAIADFRNRLLGEHLGTEPDSVASIIEDTGSLLSTVEALKTGKRTLRDLHESENNTIMESFPASMIADPERPIDIETLLDYLGFSSGRRDVKADAKRKAWWFGAVIAFAVILAILWRWTALKDVASMENLLAAAGYVRESPLTIPIVLILFVVGSCIMFPVTLMILLTALSFGPVMGFVLAFSGSLLGGLA
ncbi:MAG: hypothetical protein JW932_20270, partial [Deltaproteobacteria bacterium]|nr:hypothetical protein [Deltaproteobacteria bacterium]